MIIIVCKEHCHSNENCEVKWDVDGISQLDSINGEVEIADSNVRKCLDHPNPPSSGVELALIRFVREIRIIVHLAMIYDLFGFTWMSYAAHSLVAFIFISLHLQLIYLAVENELEDVDAPNPVHESLVGF